MAQQQLRMQIALAEDPHLAPSTQIKSSEIFPIVPWPGEWDRRHLSRNVGTDIMVTFARRLAANPHNSCIHGTLSQSFLHIEKDRYIDAWKQ